VKVRVVTTVLILALGGVVGSAAQVSGQAAPSSDIESQILWQFDTGG